MPITAKQHHLELLLAKELERKFITMTASEIAKLNNTGITANYAREQLAKEVIDFLGRNGVRYV